MDEELVEAVARLIDPDAWHDKLPQDGLATWWMDRREKAREKARAVIPIVQEHCAKVADDFERTENERAHDKRQAGRDDNFNCARASAARMLAQAIRGKA